MNVTTCSEMISSSELAEAVLLGLTCVCVMLCFRAEQRVRPHQSHGMLGYWSIIS